MRKYFLNLIFIILTFIISGCKPNVNKNFIPFLSNNLLSNNNLGQNEIFLNYWDIDKGKIYINYEKLYTGFKEGVHSLIFPYFWDGSDTFYLNCHLKDIFKKNIKIYKSSVTNLPQFSIFLKNPIMVKIEENKLLKIYEIIINEIKLKNEFEIPNDKLPIDFLKNQDIIPFIILENENDSYKIICVYPSLDVENQDNLLYKLFIIDIKNGIIDINKTKGIDRYSIQWFYGDELNKMFFIKNNDLYLQICCNNSSGLLWKINLDSGEFKLVINSLKFKKIYPSINDITKEGYVFENFIGYYKNYYIFYNSNEVIATNDNGEILGKIIIYKKYNKIEVYKNGKKTQEIKIRNSSISFQFPNY